MNDKNKKVEGFYFHPETGIPYVSVTEVLSVIDKSRPLMYWAMEKMFYGLRADPTLNFEKARAIPFASNNDAKNRGTTVHSIVEAYKNGHPIDLDSIPTQFRGYAKGFNKWVNDNKVEVVSKEKTVFSHKYGYAGTYDLVCKLNGTDDIWLIDVKTGKAIYDEVELQLSAYKQALSEEGINVTRMGVILLTEDGDPEWKEKTEKYDIGSFLNAKGLWEWKNKGLVKKIMETYQSKQLVMN